MTTHYVNLGDTIQLGTVPPAPPMVPIKTTPSDIWNFLVSRGWEETGPSTDDEWSNTAKGRNRMTWEQAMACEFYEFITLGGR